MTESTILQGGRSNQSVVKIGDTVHRTLSANSTFVHKLLLFLQQKKIIYAPKFLGIDDQNREILSYIEGTASHQSEDFTLAQLIAIVKMLREIHDATQGSELAGGLEVVCHNDIAPWNTLFRSDVPVAFIDFDEAAPGKRIEDFAYLLWTFLDLGHSGTAEEQAIRIATLCEAYGNIDSSGIVDSILEQQQRILEKRRHLAKASPTAEERSFSESKIPEIEADMEWLQANRATIENN